MSTELTVATTGNRTVLRFSKSNDIWPIVDAWAARTGYRLVSPGGAHRVYQKGTGFLVAPMICELAVEGDVVTISAWVRMNLFVRLMALFMLPAEMGIQSGGFRAVLPRNIARKAVNELLGELGQPPIP